MSQLVFKEADKSKDIYRNTAFSTNKNISMHRWVNWVAGFSSEFVEQALSLHLPNPNSDQVILDPFGGVGTTPVTAFLRGHSVISYDINPFAVLVQKTKLFGITNPLSKSLYDYIRNFEDHMVNGTQPTSKIPDGFTSRVPFYSEKVLKKVLKVWDYINSIEDQYVSDLFRIAFGATMVSYSNYSYEPSLGSRVAAGRPEIEDADVCQVMAEKLLEIYSDLSTIKRSVPKEQTFRVINGSFMRSDLVNSSIDMIITSPPYLNNYHYLRNTRPHLYWLGFAKNPKDLKYLENDNYGKYWQTVREAKYKTSLIFKSDWLQDIINQLSAVQLDKGLYSGQGWANYATEYFNDTYYFLRKAFKSLKIDGEALIVVGNSIVKGINLPIDQVFVHIGQMIGFKESEIYIVRDTRVGSSIVGTGLRAEGKGTKLYEVVVRLKR
jgi:hypothetical protein